MSRHLRLILATIALAALAAACTGAAAAPSVASLEDPATTSAPGASPTASPITDPQDAFLAYARCMRENGIDMPDPQVVTGANGDTKVTIGSEGSRPTESKEDFQKANEACDHFMAEAGPDGPAPSMSPEDQDKMLAFAKCMREHGVDMPDPTIGGGFVTHIDDGSGSGPKGPIEDEDFEAANAACGDLLPGGMGKPQVSTGGDGAGGATSGAAPDPAESN
jgi:hypothetical protein